ncbi:MAG TPA: glycosyltransferase family 1 protein [Candidatus Saccharibacteria bacterium]|nr:glycosyltransferase family 1 protein [Candidatus Saccharibacteria bacterium]
MKHIVIDARESGTSTGRYIDKLIEYLAKEKPAYKVTVLTAPKRVDFIESIAPKFLTVVSPVKEFTFSEQTRLLEQIKKLKPDLVHFGMTQQPILYRGKTITTVHDLTTARFKNPAKNPLVFWVKQKVYRVVIKIVARKSETIITPSEYVKDDLAKFAKINSRKIEVTYESADKITEASEAIEELVDKQFLLYVGRPQPHKNLDRLIEAFVSLQQKHPDLHLVLAGKKDALYWQLEKHVKNQKLENVIFTDFVSEGQLKWLYENTACYVFPSLSEGFGLPALEAMVHGAPVASSNATCLPEIYKDSAEYFSPTDIDSMTTAIEKILTNKNLSDKLRERGKKLAASYSWQRMAKKTLEIYKSTLD